jgi:hypothetical protein
MALPPVALLEPGRDLAPAGDKAMRLVLLYHEPEDWAREIRARLRDLGVPEEGRQAAVERILARAERRAP